MSDCGLSTLSWAVTPASLLTFTKKTRQPCWTSSAAAGPAAHFTRLSGLMLTWARQYLSSTSWIASIALALSADSHAAASAFSSSAASGEPRNVSASLTRFTAAANGWCSTLVTLGRSACADTQNSADTANADRRHTGDDVMV